METAAQPRPKLSSFWFWLIIIVLLASCVRLYRLGDTPQVFDADEMNVGYEAWSLWTTGADQHGTWLPLNIRGFNDYNEGLSFYLTAPFVGLFGLSEATTRLPFALMGIVSVYLTILVGRLWFSPGAGLLAGLLLAIDPWHVTFTQIAYTVGSVPLFTALALYVFTRFILALRPENNTPRRRQIIWAIFSALCFALLTLSYTPMKLQAPLLFGVCILASWKTLRQQPRTLLVWLVGMYLLFISPLIYDQLAHGPLLQQHYDHISVTLRPDWYIRIFANYAEQYNPSGLFFEGLNPIPGAVTAYGIGELFWLEGLLWVVVFVHFVRHPWTKHNFNLPLLLGLWFATYPIASVLTWVATAHREINFLPLPELLAGFGAMLVFDAIAKFRPRAVLYAGVVAGLGFYLFFCLCFLGPYFSPPLLETNATSEKIPYNVGLRTTLDYISQHSQPCDTIWLEPTYQAYIAYLFYTRYPPSKFQELSREGKVPKLTADDGWLLIPWIGNVRFLWVGEDPAPAACPGQHAQTWLAVKSGLIAGAEWQQVFSVNNADGAAIWRVQFKQ